MGAKDPPPYIQAYCPKGDSLRAGEGVRLHLCSSLCPSLCGFFFEIEFTCQTMHPLEV